MPFSKSPFVGFPFDEDRDDQEDAPFRSQLDDLAARHPEFAQHLGTFPFRSVNRTRAPVPEHFNQQRFTDRPFGDRFERFGFPFDESFKEEDQKPYYQRYPHYYPTQNSEEKTGEKTPESRDTDSELNPPEEESQGQSCRSRRPKQNIQQSNTVDLGQRQEPVDDRNQRSMSAPPPNNRPRFVSSINIPVNQPPEMATHSQTSAPSQPQERVIPIHVEGRDEPVLPKKSVSQNTGQPQQPHPRQPQPPSDKFFTQQSPNFSHYFNRDQPFASEWLPRGFHKPNQAQPNFAQGHRGKSPQPQQKPEPSQQSTNIPKYADSQQKSTDNVKMDTKEPTAEQQKPANSGKADPIVQIKSIQKDVSDLMTQVDQFIGKPKDKQYLYLDEMLTRNLIKLDNIDTQGQENIRLARKEAIRCIEKCIGILESKANANVDIISSAEKHMEVEVPETESKDIQSKDMEVEDSTVGAKELTAAEIQEIKCTPAAEESMIVDVVKNENSSEVERKTEKEVIANAPIQGVVELAEDVRIGNGNKKESYTENESIDSTQESVKSIESRKEDETSPNNEQKLETSKNTDTSEETKSEVSVGDNKKEKKKTKKKTDNK